MVQISCDLAHLSHVCPLFLRQRTQAGVKGAMLENASHVATNNIGQNMIVGVDERSLKVEL